MIPFRNSFLIVLIAAAGFSDVRLRAQAVPSAPDFAGATLPAPAAAAYERPAPVAASSLLSAESLRGPGYRVLPDADPNGMLYSFKVETDYGTYAPQSLQMMRIRLKEFAAMARLKQLSQEELFLSGMGKQLKTTARATGKALMNPVETLKQMPEGFKKFAGEIQAQQMVGQVYGESGSQTYAPVKRELAAKLGIDPYTDNQPLQQLLNEVAQNQNRGKLVASIGTLVVGGGLGVAMNVADMNEEFNNLILKKSAAQLQLDNREALMTLGLSQKKADYFLTTEGYTAANCTAITRALVTLGKIKGATGVLDVLPPFAGPESILFAQTQIQMPAQFHRTIRPLKAITFVEGTAVWQDGSGASYVFSPMECLYWDEKIDIGFSNIRREVGSGTLELWISGTATETAIRELAARGVTVQQNGLTRLWAKK